MGGAFTGVAVAGGVEAGGLFAGGCVTGGGTTCTWAMTIREPAGTPSWVAVTSTVMAASGSAA